MNLKTLTLFDGTKVCVPDSLNLITSYVLEEQCDWFEDEIKFIRKLIRPKQNIIDIGANYGLYTLAMARNIGQSGLLYAFEPCTSTAAILSESVKANGFNSVIIEKKALSNEEGKATLTINENSELNSINKNSNSSGLSEEVLVTTLDACMLRFDWKDINFVKIDAEGEEENIINGGLNFLKYNSPLIQFEIKDGNGLNLGLVESFRSLGYISYRLVPGLNVLVPWKENEVPDEFLLNLFCCKQDEAKRLSNLGLLIEDIKQSSQSTNTLNTAIEKMSPSMEGWANDLIRLPYFAFLNKHWADNLCAFDPNLIKVLNLYEISKTSNSAADRYFALDLAFITIDELCQKSAGYLRLSTLARIARELGYRATAVRALNTLVNDIHQTKLIELAEPFLFPSSDFDSINLDNFEMQLPNFLFGTLLHALEKNDSYSTFYSGKKSLDRLNAIKNLGVVDDEINRRIKLIQNRFNLH